MPTHILTEIAASLAELKANPIKAVAGGKGMPVAILNRNEPVFYCVPAQFFEALLDIVEDKELLEIVAQRQPEKSIKVDLNKL